MKMLKRTLALMLALIMMFSAVPFNAYATESTDLPSTPTEAPVDAPESEPVPSEGTEETVVEEAPMMFGLPRATTQADTFTHKIVHLDNGRKYFSADWIKALITEMAADGFTQLQLAFGNDGLRFLLDDMSVTVNGTTYSSANVTAGIQAGNKAYYDDGVNELTEAEMDEIIAHAKAKGIEIVPHLNMPGHMDAILDAIEHVGISNAHFTGTTTSVRSLNLNNATAVAFTKALLEKYVAYFAEKGCGYFHIGADEFGNDAYNGGMGFPNMGSILYAKFATFVNECAAIVTDAGMTPRAWNDGISYTQYSTSFDASIEVTYWSSGWGGYDVASASTLRSNGHSMINTNGNYYYILGVDDCYTSGNTTTHVGYNYTAAKSFTNSTFMGSTVSDPIGSMFCIWSDKPGAETETEVAMYIRPILRVMGARMQDSNSYEVDSIVEGGFNADGTLNVVVTPDPEPDVPVEPEKPETVTKTDEATQVAVTAPGLETVEVKENAAVVTEEKITKTYSITLNGGAYTEAATVKIPYDTAFDGCNVFTGKVGEDTFPVTKDGDFFLCEVPHFSDVEIEGRAVTQDTISSNGEAGPSYVKDTNGIDANDTYVIVYDNKALGLSGNSVTAVDVTENNDGTLTIPAGVTIETLLWKRDSSNMYNENAQRYLYIQGYACSTYASSQDVTFSSYNKGYQVYRDRTFSTDYYLRYNSGWTGTSGTTNATRVELYKYTPSSAAYTVDAALQESRITALTVANTGYTDDSWNAYQAALTAAQNKLTSVEGATYNSEGAANTALSNLIAAVNALKSAKDALEKAVQITINYVDKNGTTVKTETVNVSDKATSVALSNFNANDKFYVVEKATLAITPATKTEYTVEVTETEADLTNVTPLEIEYWITNARITGNESNLDHLTIAAADNGVYSENGIAIATLVDASGSTGGRNQTYWQSKILDVQLTNDSTSGTEFQTLYTGDDETLNGASFTHIRYWNGAWQVKTSAGWVSVDRSDVTVTDYDSDSTNGKITREKNQLIAYYMEVVDIKNANNTTELVVNTADWGKKGDGTPANDYLDPKSTVSVSVQIIYEDGTGNPANVTNTVYPTVADLRNKTIVYSYWTEGRGLGTMVFTGGEQFEIYKVTAETGGHTVSGSTWEGVTINSFTWDNNAKTVWEDDPTDSVTIGNPAHKPSKEDPRDNLMWDENHEAILLRVYVKAVETEDSLKVVYFDEKFGDTLYEYNITVPSDDNFNDDMIGKPTTMGDRINVSGCGIKNVYGVTQNFQTDLTKVPEAVGKYHNELYTYTGSEIKDDGKTLYLYYNINTKVLKPNFVVDFGLPITFNLSDIVENVGAVDSVGKLSARYGDVSYDSSTQTFTYTPTKVLQNVDVLSITLTMAGTTSTTNVGVTPATTVYYGEKFINFGTGWTTEGTPSPAGNQATEVLGNSSYYGYDIAYNKLGASDGTSKKATAIGSSATFEFTGTGIQVFANATESSGYASVTVKNKATGKTMRMAMVDTVVNGTEGTETTGGQSGNLAGLPIVSLVDLANIPYATYTVTISKVMDTDPIYIDGIRVFDSINAAAEDESNIYYNDHEDRPDFYELRDVVLKALNIQISESADYETMYQQLYDASVGTHASAIVTTSGSIDYTATDNKDARQDLLDNGPKNELYLFPGDTLTFNVSSTARIMQLGMKAPNTAVDAEVTIGNTTTTKYDIDSSVDMFYKIQDAAQTATNYTVQVKNASGSGILSVTLLKICDDPSFAFAPLTEDNIKAILADAGYTEETPDVPDVPETPVEPEVPEETTKPSKPNKPSKPEKPGKPENTKPTEPEVEETTKPSKPGKPENTKPTEPQKPGKPGNNGNQKPGKPGKDEEKTYTLKITFVNLFGKKVGTATITTTNGVVSASQIAGKAPARYKALWFIPVTLRANGNTSIVVPVI